MRILASVLVCTLTMGRERDGTNHVVWITAFGANPAAVNSDQLLATCSAIHKRAAQHPPALSLLCQHHVSSSTPLHVSLCCIRVKGHCTGTSPMLPTSKSGYHWPPAYSSFVPTVLLLTGQPDKMQLHGTQLSSGTRPAPRSSCLAAPRYTARCVRVRAAVATESEAPGAAQDAAAFTAKIVEEEAKYVLQTYARPADVVFVRGEGAKLYDAAGKEYLDMAAGGCWEGLLDWGRPASRRRSGRWMRVGNSHAGVHVVLCYVATGQMPCCVGR